MKVSRAINTFVIVLSASIVVLAVPAVLYLNAQICCKKALRYSPMVWYPPFSDGIDK
jgi:hypothetical protein